MSDSQAEPADRAERRLVITADDFGAGESVNAAVERAHVEGVLTAASLMVAAPGAADAVERARRLPKLGVGLHLVLVEGRPASPPERVDRLVDADGCFRTDMTAAGARMFFDPVTRRQLALEIEAQFAAFAATGLPLDHLNAHKHFHLHPTIGELALRIGRRFGLRSARAPLEPRAVIRRIEPGTGGPLDALVEGFARRARRRFADAGLMTPDQVFGLAWSGAMTTARLSALLEALPPGLTEIYLHPGMEGGFEGAADGYRYADEFAALTDLDVGRLARRPGVRLGRFADFL
ncbi:MAG TPA: hopanoid biosynthesis-associated protein HpnK [Caulobacteraceae bacterium]|jgi:hopanoid biosynthesis associated protein HpnK|nr:hopanoid biosynthesis-associated protein HpnK [Caulobacteraceae bacterium]